MDIKEYIESGVLEAYALGALPADEAARVQADLARNPELAAELAAIEETMYQFAANNAQEPPAGMAERIWATIDATGREQTEKPAARTIPVGSSYSTRWNMAAMWAALVISLAGNALFWYRNSEQKREYVAQTTRMEQMATDINSLAGTIDEYRKNKAMMADTGMQTVVMHTMQPGHPMAATLFWSKQNGDAYVSIDALPEPPKGMQYQLWVMQDGKPVDMGVLPTGMANTPAIQKVNMKVMEGQAFAISLEKQGGSPTPTMQNIYVMGKPA